MQLSGAWAIGVTAQLRMGMGLNLLLSSQALTPLLIE